MSAMRGPRWIAAWAVLICACGGGEMGEDGGQGFDSGPVQHDGGGTGCTSTGDCADDLFCNGVEQCNPSSPDADENGCTAGPPACSADEMCLEDSDTCRPDCPVEPDADSDGHIAIECGGDDCDDLDGNTYPGNVEVCDSTGHDEDCNPETFGFLDADGDGAASSACCNVLGDGSLGCGTDCNDADSTVNPRAGDGPPLYCDGVDNNCDTVADNGCPCTEGETRACGTDAQLGHVGICAPGTNVCAGGAFTDACIGAIAPQEEICDGLDNDCDGTSDEGVLRTYYVDADGDGYGVPGATIQACSPPSGYAVNSDDCDDGRTGVSPAATEVCNGLDDNCSGAVDEGFTATFYRDADGDGFGDATMSTTACAPPTGYVRVATDCDDTHSAQSPAAVEVCDGLDNNCDGRTDEGLLRTFYRDTDGDGWGQSAMSTSACSAPTGYVDRGNDCNDSAAGSNPAAPEVCDGADNDCDGSTDEGVQHTYYRDSDRDSFGQSSVTMAACSPPSGYVDRGDDCNDTTSSVNPAAAERCNGVDDNCDGSTDTGCSCTDGASRSCGPTTETGECAFGTEQCTAGSWGSCVGAVLSSAEVCNGRDDDCDGTVDNGVIATGCYRDGDGDSFGTGGATTQCRDATRMAFGYCPTGFTNNASDCNDGVTVIHPGATEVCDGVDQDCDGMVDDGATLSCYLDADGDGIGTGSSVQRCADPSRPTFGNCPSGYANITGDCNDSNATVRPSAAEMCNGVDDDCNGTIDDGVLATGCYLDADSDGYGTGSASAQCRDSARSAYGYCPVGYTNVASDCNDASSGIHPSATETCNAIDDDCNGTVDDSLRVACYVDADSDGYGAGSSSMQCRDGARSSYGYCPAGYVNNASDCNDTLATVRPGGTEACNGIDDDCDMTVDDGVLNTYYRDADTDGYGVTGTTATGCMAPAGYVAASGDCNDANAAIHPGATEICNGVDDNCASGTTDEPRRTFYRDSDGDLYGTSSTTTTACSPPAGYVEYSGDCNDTNAMIRPGATEICNGVDDNCDSTVDGAAASSQCAGANPLAVHVSSWTCSAGACTPTCGTHYGNCDSLTANGCETDTSTDVDHCNTCGNACGTGGMCSGTGPYTCDHVADLWAGTNDTCARRSSGRVACWGRGASGELADPALADSNVPVWIDDLYNIDRGELGASLLATHGCASSAGRAYCWGNNFGGQVGDGTALSPRPTPALVYNGSTIVGFGMGLNHTCVVSSTRAYCWGDNYYGQLGLDIVAVPYQYSAGASVSGFYYDISAGDYFTCALSSGPSVKCWGMQTDGRLGNGLTTVDRVDTPQTVGFIAGFAPSDVECGTSHCCAIGTYSGASRTYCWGNNGGGRLGNGGTTSTGTPQLVGGSLTFVQLAGGGAHTCGLTSGSRVYCWGNNGNGQLGVGDTTQRTSPALVTSLSNVIAIAAGASHTCAVTSAYDVYCWGDNSNGQLGDGTNTQRLSPILVGSL